MSREDNLGPGRRLPVRVLPKRDESFASWAVRTAASNGTTTYHLVETASDEFSHVLEGRGRLAAKTYHTLRIPDRLEAEAILSLLSLLTGIDEDVLSPTRLHHQGYNYASMYLTPDGIVPHLGQEPFRRDTPRGLESFCPSCLAESYHLHREWRTAFLPLCVAHNRTLLDRCPSCQAGLGFYQFDSTIKRVHEAGTCRCRQCDFNLVSAPCGSITSEMAQLHRFLTVLLEAKIGFDPIQWDRDIPSIVHRLMAAFFQVQEGGGSPSPSPAGSHRPRSWLPDTRAAYVFAPCLVRSQLFAAVCSLVEKLRSPTPALSEAEAACWSLLTASKQKSATRFAQAIYPRFAGRTSGLLIVPPPARSRKS